MKRGVIADSPTALPNATHKKNIRMENDLQQKFKALIRRKAELEMQIQKYRNDFFMLYGPVREKERVERQIVEVRDRLRLEKNCS